MRNPIRACSTVLALLVLAACSSPAPPRYHSLLPAQTQLRAVAGNSPTAWQLLPVSIPTQVDQPQFVIRRADETFAVLEQERWIAPLGDELRAALSEHLGATLGAPGAAPLPGRKDWRIAVDVQRFDSTPGRSTLAAQWTLLAGSDTPALRCRVAGHSPRGFLPVAPIPARNGTRVITRCERSLRHRPARRWTPHRGAPG